MTDPLFGLGISPIEALAFALSLACVALTVRELHWAWPLSIAASALYGGLFWSSRLYGEALLQGAFIGLSAWGWWQWLGHGPRTQAPLRIRRLPPRRRWLVALALIAGWLALGTALARWTDTDVAWLDAFPSVGSLIAQALLARKWIETWHLWLLVNAAAVVLFAWKGLWLTVILYALLFGLAAAGLRRWQSMLDGSPCPEGRP